MALDLLVNAHLLRFAFSEPPAILGSLYPADRFPWNLLLPPSTGGTDFDCVISHALERDFRRILVATDGAAALNETLRVRAAARRLRVFTVLTSTHTRDSPIVRMAEQWWVLPAVGKLRGPAGGGTVRPCRSA